MFLFCLKKKKEKKKKPKWSEKIEQDDYCCILFLDFEKNLENQPVLPDTENKQK